MSKRKALAFAPVRNLMKSVGAQIVARDAVDLVVSATESKIKACTADALKIARNANHIKITPGDLKIAFESCKL